MSQPAGDLVVELVTGGTIVIPAAELSWRYSTSGGPGGQHANTSNTRAEVVWEVAATTAVGPDRRATLVGALGPTVAVAADDTRSQSRNRELARERLAARIAEVLRPRKARRPSRPGRRANQRRLDAKKRRSRVKRFRQDRHDD